MVLIQKLVYFLTDCREKIHSHTKEMESILLVHGGAGNIRDSRVLPKTEIVKQAVKKGYEILNKGGSAVDAVEEAVRIMEDNEYLNAGKGSVLNSNGEVEMDASIMDGRDLNAGAVAVVKDIPHAITLARLVMEKTPHVFLAGAGAVEFAKTVGMPILPPGSLVTKDAEEALANFRKYGDPQGDNYGEVGTVGAVALDSKGHVAAATSTGGTIGKMPGRVGDTPLLGSGTYADDEVGAVSTTGHGESIQKMCVAHTIINEMKKGMNAQEATNLVLKRMTEKLKNTAGAITVSKKGEIGVGMTTRRMPWAYIKGNKLVYGIDPGSSQSETL
ncbi:hypothetical protein WA026_019087 [Henosepilachna vigintioctopunctata]|uniref:Asparaginase n=1 Tax=Henosepilachna vigintioctopunctata TaxID=420089 RepID=A0AAW1VIC4_9CUCU